MPQVLPAIRIKYEGRDAAHNLIDVRELAISLKGTSQLLTSASHVLFAGEVGTARAKPKIRFYAQPVQKGSFPIDIVGYSGDLVKLASQVVAALGVEAIQRLISIAILLPSGRRKEVDPHFEQLMELTKKIQADAHASQEMLLARSAQSEKNVRDIVETFAQQNRRAVSEAVHPIGRTCADTIFGDEKRGGVVVDLPTAQTIRSEVKLEIGEMQKFKVHVDGIIAHNKTVKLYIEGCGERIITGDLLDPAADKWPNIYKDSVKSGVLEVTGKPTLKEGEIIRLAVFDAKKIKGDFEAIKRG